jgi:hypothetical protein
MVPDPELWPACRFTAPLFDYAVKARVAHPGRSGVVMEVLTSTVEMVRQFLSRFGPYFIVEILLPGGTLLALLLYLYRRRKFGTGHHSFRPAIAASRALAQTGREYLNARPS